MHYYGDSFKTLLDPLNEPPPPTQPFAPHLATPAGSPLEGLLAELSAGRHGWRIKRMTRDYNWLASIAKKRGISMG